MNLGAQIFPISINVTMHPDSARRWYIHLKIAKPNMYDCADGSSATLTNHRLDFEGKLSLISFLVVCVVGVLYVVELFRCVKHTFSVPRMTI